MARGTFFPISEAFGFDPHATSEAAADAWRDHRCPFAEGACEKQRQYGYGYCSVIYAAEWDKGVGRKYAVCDHRLDGAPVRWAVNDHFRGADATLVPEVTVLTGPKLNIDYMAYRDDVSAEDSVDMIGIETQAIDLRGGGVGPAWKAWIHGEPERWREYFTEEAATKGRRDRVDYGVNTGNVYKRLGTQVAIKGQYLRGVHVPLYVITQQLVLDQLRKRVPFEPAVSGQSWDVTFAGFEYPETPDANGMFPMTLASVVRTSLDSYIDAMSAQGPEEHLRADLIAKMKAKAAGRR